jgi:hypothetical protein
MTKRLWILYGNALEYIQSLPETKKRLMIPPQELSLTLIMYTSMSRWSAGCGYGTVGCGVAAVS